MNKALAVAVGAGVLGALLPLWVGFDGDRSPGQASQPGAELPALPKASAGASREQRDESAGHSQPKPEPRSKPSAMRRSTEKWAPRRKLADEIHAKLAALYGTHAARMGGEVPSTRFMPRPAGSGNQAGGELGRYTRDVVREQFVPVAGSCYEQLLERDPSAAGDVVLEFSIVGNADLGGVVESVQVDEQHTTLDEEEFVTCVRESMYTTTFDAPPNDQAITVVYPLSFAP